MGVYTPFDRAFLICSEGMALANVKTEMKGTGGGRWATRFEAKKAAKKHRRRADKAAVKGE